MIAMISTNDINGFFADDSTDLSESIIETYWFETSINPDFAAAALCSEQSTAQWKRPCVDEDLRRTCGAKVIGLEIIEVSDKPVFESPFNKGNRFTRCRVTIAHPYINFGTKIPNLLTAACGEGAFHSPGITAIKLLDIGFPKKYLNAFQGPQFGTRGIQDLLKVRDRPLFMGVVKPNIGLAPKNFSEIAYQSWIGGLDIAKDDEMQSDTEISPIAERLCLMNAKRMEAEDLTGEKKIFLVNITDEVDRLVELHDLAVKNGAGAVMVNSMTVGLSAIRMLRKHAEVPIVGHFDFIAPFSRLPFFGVSQLVITKLQRLTGCDSIIMPGFSPRMMVDEEEVKTNVEACLAEFGDIKKSLPVPGGSDWAGTIQPLYHKLRSIDFGFVFGRGVFDHPKGAEAGAKSIRQAWEATAMGVSIEEYAKENLELREAIEAFGKTDRVEEDSVIPRFQPEADLLLAESGGLGKGKSKI